MQMIMFVLHDPSKVEGLVDAWRRAQVQEVTVVEGECLMEQCVRHISARYAFGFRGTRHVEEPELVLFGFVPDEDAVRACIAATEQVVGSLKAPGHGVLAAWPVTAVVGLAEAPPTED